MMGDSSYTTWLEQHMLQCPSKKMFAVDCPGCGLQRSIIDLLRGDIAASWDVYPPGIFIVITIIILVSHLLFGVRYGALMLKMLFIITISVITINYIYKIANHQLL